MKINQLKIPKVSVYNQERNLITQTNENIKIQLSNVITAQKEDMKKETIKWIETILDTTNQLIIECHTLKEFKISRNTNLSRLIYEYQRLNSKYEIFKMQSQVDTIKESYKSIEDKQRKLTIESGNLVYNILGFIASFSIVSASVSAIQSISSIENIALFMAFTAFILITTLIGLNNFYKVKENSRKKLENNYFLWCMLIFVIVMIFIYKGIVHIKNNKDDIYTYIDKEIENIIEQKVENKIN